MNKYKCASCKTETSNIIHANSKGWFCITGDLIVEFNVDGTCHNSHKEQLCFCSENCFLNYVAFVYGRIKGYEPTYDIIERRVKRLSGEFSKEQFLKIARRVLCEK